MCTVTFFPLKDGFVLTSSRDEQKQRATFPPQFYEINQQNIFFPKDKTAGGTWIASNANSKTVCLLNGAFEKHQRKSSYTKSRGLVLLESISQPNFNDFIEQVDLTGVEPFTLLMIDSHSSLSLTELRWDEHQKHIKIIDITQPHIWSSSTLYDEETRVKRKLWFAQLLNENKAINEKKLFNFHNSKHDKESSNDIVMERPNGLQTVSISQIVHTTTTKSFSYNDLIEDYFLKVLINA